MLVIIKELNLGAIVPRMDTDKLPGGWRHARTYALGHRLVYVRVEAAKEWGECEIINISDGNLARLPVVEYFALYANQQAGLAVLTRKEIEFNWREMNYPGYFGSTFYPSRPTDYLAKANELAQKEKLPLLDCTDGDFSKLPAPPQPEPEPEVEIPFEDEDFEDDDGHEDDED